MVNWNFWWPLLMLAVLGTLAYAVVTAPPVKGIQPYMYTRF